MPIRKLKTVFAPEQIAVVGASMRRSSAGDTVLQNLPGSGLGDPMG
ncbi:hypothetical protein Enr13x_01690 [Stieleria neptunia]|uniref:Uncharacterized protein n=1 Tax=Stieleria neptunia TaxID=2527979 RepID=A0A518HHN8_9BACT|nr:hypothetical protein [Stieleria neptunia]QDV40363.1 hypothetical protein Enr13x_01690 [Stieleria neptunia]